MKKIVIVIILVCLINACVAEEGKIAPDELAELRRNPDTSQAAWMTERDKKSSSRTSPEEEQELSANNKSKVHEDPNNPSVFIGDPDEPDARIKRAASG